jgi:RimJ/RimL family protein N-acetyltransferase
MLLETQRLIITEFTMDMARVVHENSLDEDNRRFVPDEVFETEEDAAETIEFLMGQYDGKDGPFVYPVIAKEDKTNLGYVQMAPLDDGVWEIGYHIAKQYTGNGYATEAVKAFLPLMADRIGIAEVYGICLAENDASVHVLKKCGFDVLFEGEGEYQGEKREIFKSVWRK